MSLRSELVPLSPSTLQVVITSVEIADVMRVHTQLHQILCHVLCLEQDASKHALLVMLGFDKLHLLLGFFRDVLIAMGLRLQVQVYVIKDFL